MRKLAYFITCLTLILAAGCLFAQQYTTISGTVVDAETGNPLPGANVTVIGETLGAATDADGEFSFTMALDREIKLVVTYMGYKSQELNLGPGSTTTGLVFEMEPDVIGLERVVVTALGLTQEEKALGYSQQTISSMQLTETPETNIVSSLSGQASGVQVVSSSGQIGSSARIQIRGISSLTGDNQPLFVVDGVPINNFSQNTSLGDLTADPLENDPGGTYVDFGNAAADVNPYDVKSINILKGANAAALYGSRALNGVVEITTKTGHEAGLVMKQGLGISYNTHITLRRVNSQTKFQNKYGQGGIDWDRDMGTAAYGYFAYVDGNYGGVFDGTDESWGPPMDGYLSEHYDEWYGNDPYIVVQGPGEPLLVPQYNSPLPNGTIDPSVYSEDRTPTPWVSHPNNFVDFFETGITQEHNLSFYGGSMAANYRLSLTHQNEKGIMPNTDQTRNSVYMSGNLQLSRKLSISGVANYVNTKNDNLVGNGYGGLNPMQQMQNWIGRQMDFTFLKENIEKEDGTPYRWNYSYHDSPYWILYKNLNSRNRHRLFGNVSANYKFNSWLTATARMGTDWYIERTKYIRAMYTNDFPEGNFEDQNRFSRETNIDVFLRAQKPITDDINLNMMVGGNYRENKYKWDKIEVLGLVIPELYSVSNASVKPVTDMEIINSQSNSVYGRIAMDFRDYLFVEATGRNDWSSTLPEDNRSYFYPSVTTSFIFSDFFNIDPEDLFGKVRASWAVVGNTAEPYSLIGTFLADETFMGYPNLTYANTLANSELKPEEKTSIEFGTDLKFFKNRLNLSVTYYMESTINQIMDISISGASGFTRKWINAGKIENKGIELSLGGTPVKMDKFQWDVNINWAKNQNKVVELYGDVQSLDLWPQTWGGLKVLARVGEPWGQLYGYPTMSYNGKPLLDETGNYRADLDNPGVLGNVLPDWTGGIRNTFKYGPFSLSALIDMSIGGDVFSVTNMFGMYAGTVIESVEGMDGESAVTGGDIRIAGAIIDGYQQLEDGSYVQNETPVNANDMCVWYWPSLGGHELSIFDATWVKLRSINFSYRIPDKWVNRFGFVGASVALEGRNLFILYKKAPNIDPETGFSANIVQGIESNQFPSTRIFGISLKLDL